MYQISLSKFFLFSVLIFACLIFAPSSRAELTWTTMFQAPGPLPDGMTWDGQYLWITSETPQRVFKVDTTGVAMDTLTAPGASPTGLTWDGNHLWVGSHTTRRIYKVDPVTGTVETSFVAPGATSNEGLAFDGTYLWNTNWANNIIWKLDTLGVQQGQFQAPGGANGGSTGLTWDGTYLWNSDQNLDSIYQIDPANGQVIRREDAPDTVAQDLAFDGMHLWTCGYYSQTVYRSSPITGINENRLPNNDLSILKLSSSNPVKENSHVKLQISMKGIAALNLYDALGRYVNTIWKGTGPCDDNITFSTKNLSSGLYFLRLNTEKATKTLKLIVNQ
jgi:outer membrane protein assembly factor BamB